MRSISENRKHCKPDIGYASLKDVGMIGKDNMVHEMQSFFIGEILILTVVLFINIQIAVLRSIVSFNDRYNTLDCIDKAETLKYLLLILAPSD